MTSADEPYRLFDAEFLRKLQLLEILSRRIFRGRLRGEKRSSKRGTSVEFADFREYAPGDDFRYVDWNAYARLEDLFLKLFVEEEDLFVYLLLDGSASMDFPAVGGPGGEPASGAAARRLHKLTYAKKVAAALAYIALCHLDRASVQVFRQGLAEVLAPVRGKAQIFSVFSFLTAVEPAGETALGRATHEFVLRNRRRGPVVVISDFLSPSGYADGVSYLAYHGFEPILLQVLAPEELEPTLTGDLRLVDAETAEEVDVSVSRRVIAAYRRRLDRFCGGLRRFALTRGMTFLETSTATAFEDLILRYLREAMVLA